MTTYTLTEMSPDIRNRVGGELQPLLFDLIALGLQGKQAHWNVVGPFFQSVHAQLDQIVGDARGWSDEVAERMVTIGVSASGQALNIAQQSSIDPLLEGTITDKQAISFICDRIGMVATRARRAADSLGDSDLASQDLVLEILRGLEKHLWMLRVQQQS
jgi:starvation-inducible DNA-binding protein